MYKEIVLEYPYTKDWDTGSVRIGDDNRRRILLYRNGKRLGTTYARYLLAVKLGRYLTRDETADHIDEDKTNDAVDNLQLLSRSDNAKKNHEHRNALRDESNPLIYILNCPICNSYFSKKGASVRFANGRGYTLTCSRSCRGKLPKVHTVPKAKQHSPEVITEVLELYSRGLSSYQIATKTGLARRQVMQIKSNNS